MRLINRLSLSFLLTSLVVGLFVILWTAMTWREYQDSLSDIEVSSLEFVKQDLASLQLDLEYKSELFSKRSLSRRGVNTRYKVLAFIDEKGIVNHATNLAYVTKSSKIALPNFDVVRFEKVKDRHQTNVYYKKENEWISVYFPVILERLDNEIRPTKVGVIFAIYDLSQEKLKIWNRVKNSAIKIGLLLLFFMLIILLFLNHYVTKPIEQLVNSSSKIADGLLGVISPINGTGEVTTLGNTFNRMSVALQARFEERQQVEDKLRQYQEQLEEIVQERTKELTKANHTLKKLSEIDPLTEVFNRRVYQKQLTREVAYAKRTRQELALMIIDIDFFKNYNDHYGHDAGDITLQLIAKTIQESSPRQTDLVARFGGEEFVVLMPATNKIGVCTLADNIRTRIEALEITHKTSELFNIVTVSIGASSLSGDSLNEEALFKEADLALYTAKDAGRNQCKFFSN
jgi:diguanylate cyclase (GGDEF)-like protein